MSLWWNDATVPETSDNSHTSRNNLIQLHWSCKCSTYCYINVLSVIRYITSKLQFDFQFLDQSFDFLLGQMTLFNKISIYFIDNSKYFLFSFIFKKTLAPIFFSDHSFTIRWVSLIDLSNIFLLPCDLLPFHCNFFSEKIQ